VMATSVLSTPARVSSFVSFTRDRWARSMSSETCNSTMLAAIWKAGIVIPITRNTNCPVRPNTSRMPAATVQASRAVRSRCSSESVGVIAKNDGTVASGSTITNSDPNANKMYSDRLMP